MLKKSTLFISLFLLSASQLSFCAWQSFGQTIGNTWNTFKNHAASSWLQPYSYTLTKHALNQAKNQVKNARTEQEHNSIKDHAISAARSFQEKNTKKCAALRALPSLASTFTTLAFIKKGLGSAGIFGSALAFTTAWAYSIPAHNCLREQSKNIRAQAQELTENKQSQAAYARIKYPEWLTTPAAACMAISTLTFVASGWIKALAKTFNFGQ